jgi:hypothetical protein
MADPPPFPDLETAPWTPANFGAAVKRIKNDRVWKWKEIINSEDIRLKREKQSWYTALEKSFKITRAEMVEHSRAAAAVEDEDM